MDYTFNTATPTIMHIDLNSCFATIEQQAFVHLRNKPVVVSAYDTGHGLILSPSMEAKRYGIKVCMSNDEAKRLCPEVIVRTPNPSLVRDIHVRFKKIFKTYSSKVIPKSIDEAILDFTFHGFSTEQLWQIGKEIKQRMRNEIGEWISCSVGISTNRFLAKTAASLKKPDGLEMITYKNALDVYRRLKLTDLNGIAERNAHRLQINGIYTPVDLYYATVYKLHKQVFHSITGYYWYRRMRGWEIDDYDFERKSYGQQYALGKKTGDVAELSRIIMRLCEKMGRRLRKASYTAQGVHLACYYEDYTSWNRGRKKDKKLFTTSELYKHIMVLFHQQPIKKVIAKIAVTCFDLEKYESLQLDLFDLGPDKKKNISDAMDRMNDRYGECTVVSANMMDMKNVILDRVAFGSVRELEDLYE